MVQSACIGFCRSSDNAKLSDTVQNFLSGDINELEFRNYCKKVRLENIQVQKQHGIDLIPSNDFSFFDNLLDATCLVGNIPKRFYWEGGKMPLDKYFILSRGVQKDKFDALPFDRQKWLNTNYFCYCYELSDLSDFIYSDNKPIMEYLEAKSVGIDTRSVIISPITYLLNGKVTENGFKNIEFLNDILSVYSDLFDNYKRIGVKKVQIDDYFICDALDSDIKEKYSFCYSQLAKYAEDIELDLVTYYGNVSTNFDFIKSIPVNSIHIDCPYNKENIDEILAKCENIDKKISLGIVDSRSVWKNNLSESIDIVSKFCDKIGSDNVIISNSSPLFLCPYSVKKEESMPLKLQEQLSFSVEKLDELGIIKQAINNGKSAVKEVIKKNNALFSKKKHTLLFNKTTNTEHKHNTIDRNSNQVLEKYSKDIDPILIFGNDVNTEFNSNENIHLYSASVFNIKDDIGEYLENQNSVYICQNNHIPLDGYNYYNPIIVYDDITLSKNKIEKKINDIKKNTKKPIKLSVYSPLTFINLSHISPFIDVNNLLDKLTKDLANCINNIAKDIELLQVDDFTFNNHLNVNNLTKDSEIENYYYKLNTFFTYLTNVKNIIFDCDILDVNIFNKFVNILNTNIFTVNISRFNFSTINNLYLLKYNKKIAIKISDSESVRLPTKDDLQNLKKIIANKDGFKTILILDKHKNLDNSQFTHFLNNIMTVFKSDKEVSNKSKQKIKKVDKQKKYE